jgi:hypothetical protein
MKPEYIIEICVAIDIAILGIAYPIIVDKISNIGDKFTSQYIPVLFNSEFPHKPLTIKIKSKIYSISIFKLTLYATLISLFFLIFKFPPLFGWDNWFINNSAKYLVLFMSTMLTVFFFAWLDKVVLYNGKSKSLLKHIINRFESIDKQAELRQYHLKAINELTFYAIEKQDEHLQETLLEFYFKVFTDIRSNHDKEKPLVYPIDLYFLVNKLNEKSVSVDNKKLRAIEHRAVSGNWLLGEDFEEIEISEDTYNWLWRSIYEISDNSRLLKMFWANSSQYIDFRLQTIYPDFSVEARGIINQVQVNKRDEERKQFLEFHYALGGLSLYRKQYGFIKYIFEYSQSQPPKYPLLPTTMTEIFQWFENFRNEFKNRRIPVDTKYYFPELDNLGNRRQVNYWICSYLTLLFIRQYSLHKYYTFQNFTASPNLPDDIMELSNWLDSLTFFEKCLNDTVANKEIIDELKYEDIVQSKKDEFKTFLGSLKTSITDKIGRQKLEAPISDEKLQKFYSTSNKLITSGFKQFEPIFTIKTDEYNNGELKISINGASTLMSKSAFTEGDIPHLNYDSVFAASIVSNRINQLIPNAFSAAKKTRYLLNKDNIIQGLNKIINGQKNIVLIGFSIGYELKQILENSDLREKVQYFPSTSSHVRDVIFLMKESDLPAIEHKGIKESEIAEFKLIPLNQDLKTYASVIDINTEENQEIKEKWNLDNTPDNADLKVQMTISFLSYIFWKNKRSVIQVNFASEFREQGIQNDINDIEPIE